MRQDSTQAEGSVVLASGSAAGGTGQPDGTVVLPKIAPLGARLSVRRPRIAFGPVAGRIALGSLAFGALLVVLFATARRSPLVPHSGIAFPAWEAGPLHGLWPVSVKSNEAINIGFSVLLVAMLVAYGVAIAAVRATSMRLIWVWVVAVHLILLMSPPLQLTDLFNYLGYARLGGVHHLNPYVHGMGLEYHDPIIRFTSWSHLRSPYGYLFSAITYPIAMLPIPVAYWVLKVITVLLSLTFIWLIWKCAVLLGRDPRFAVALVALNPVYFVYALGGFHNDFFMLVPLTAAIALLLLRRDRSAGAAVMIAVFVKFIAVLLLPFLLVAARPARRRRAVLVGAALTAVPLVALSVALFGSSLPNLSQQGSLLTPFSIPDTFGYLIGAGGATTFILRIADVAFVVAIVLLVRRRGDWLTHAGWAMVALIASLAWLMPWYVVWMLPLAALASSVRLRRAAGVLTVFVVLTFMPVNLTVFDWLNFNPTHGAAWRASHALQTKLYSYH